VDQFTDDVMNAIVFAHIVDGNDVGVIHERSGSRLLFESAALDRVGGRLWREDLQSYVTAQPRIPRTIHFTHSSSAEELRYPVRAELCIDRKPHFRM
jgi:hypothetical protein